MSFSIGMRIAAALAAVVLIGTVFAMGYLKGEINAAARCEADALRAQLAEVKRQAEATDAALAEATRVNDEHRRQIESLEAEAEAFAAELENSSAGDAQRSCTLSDDDARRLRDIR